MVIGIDLLAQEVVRLYASGERERANRIAMDGAGIFLQQGAQESRVELFQKVFYPLTKGYGTQYQPYDFEVVDYNLYEFSPSMPLLRGPRVNYVDVVTGNYCVVLGAAQMFGRFHRRSVNEIIQNATNLPVFNFSTGGAGPSSFLKNEPLIEIGRRSKFVILQVLSGRSIGSEEYPGERMTSFRGRADFPRRDRLELLGDLYRADKSNAISLVHKWNENYVLAYRALIEKIARPVILVWVSDRPVGSWDIRHLDRGLSFGRFPHLVSESMIKAIAEKCHAFIEAPPERSLPYSMQSRFTGHEIPYFLPDNPAGAMATENKYYASQTAIEEACVSVIPILRPLLTGN